MSVVTDPEALALVMDARVQALMADPTDLPMSTIPVIIHRERHPTASDGDTVRIRETVATTVADGSGAEMPGFPETDVALALNARTREYLAETEDGRTGALSFPLNVDAEETYSLYVSAATQPLPAEFVRSEVRSGLDVMVFEISVKDRLVGTHSELGAPMVVDSQITVWVEPRTGRVVDTGDTATTLGLYNPATGKIPVFVSKLKLTDDSVAGQIVAAKDDRAQLALNGTYLPFGSVGLGVLLLATGVGLWRGLFGGWPETAKETR
jgi:hypothetical protein